MSFLFTDVEGSTALLHELGAARYAEAHERHRDIVRAALAEHGGLEVDTQGDAFFCVFESARSAVACARDLQLVLAETPIRVRIGVHTGEALPAGDHYVGLDVHRAARIAASHARPLPATLARDVREIAAQAVREGDASLLRRAHDRARRGGYA